MFVSHTVKVIEKITPSILKLSLKRNEGEPIFSYEPGQYATISFKRGKRPSVERCFSISSSPTNQETVEFGIRVGGRFTSALEKLKEGDTVTVRGPFGGFVFDAPNQHNVVFCAGGIGIAPFISMIRYAAALNLKNNITLLYSARNQDEIAYYDEINDITVNNKNIRVFFVVGDGAVTKIHLAHRIYKGYITSDILAEASNNDFGDTTFFLCGPPPFMSSLVSTLKKSGVPHENILTEAFSQGKQKGKGRGWPFNIYVIGALGTFVSSLLVMSSDMLKTIPSTVLPSTLENDNTVGANSRQKDIDSLINKLEIKMGSLGASPSVKSAEEEVAAAQAIIDSQKSSNTGTSDKTNTNNSSSSKPSTPATTPAPAPTPTPTPAPTPTPTPPKQTCTTNASGVTVCN